METVIPSKESLDRAREWMIANDIGRHDDEPPYMCMPYDDDVNQLAILLDRVRLEGKIEAINETILDKSKMRINSTLKLIHSLEPLRAKLAQLTQRAGEEGA